MSQSAQTSSAAPAAIATDRRKLTICVYAVAVFFYWASLYLYMPTLPVYVQSKSESLALVGVVLSMYGLWQALVRLPLGIAADWLGWRKPFIIVGLALSGIGAVTMALASDVSGLTVGRAITGLAAGTWVPLVAVFSSLFPSRDAVRASAMLALVASAARGTATAITGSLNELGGYPLAFFLAAAAAVAAILVVLPAREKRRSPQRPSVRSIGVLFARRDVLLPALLQGVGQYASWTATFGFLPVLGKELGATDVALSLLVSMNIGAVLLGNSLATTIVRRLGSRRLVYASFLLMSTGLGLAAMAPSLPVIFGAQLCIGLGQGIGYPLLMGMSIEHVAEEERTTAMGLHQSVYAFGMFGGPWLSGMLADRIGIRPTFGITAATCLLMGVLGARWLVQRKGVYSDVTTGDQSSP